jgi:hypothetical protein
LLDAQSEPLASTRYAVSVDDVVAYNVHFSFALRAKARHRLRLQTLWNALATGGIFGWLIGRDTHNTPVGAGVGVALAIALYPIYYRYMRHAVASYVRRIYDDSGADNVVGTHTLELVPEGIREYTATSQSFFSWPAVRVVSGTNDHVFLQVGALQAHILPRAAITPAIANCLNAHLPRDKFVGVPLGAA